MVHLKPSIKNFIFLSAITIAVFSSIMYWMGGISWPYFTTGKLEITKTQIDTTPTYWNITIQVQNIGTKTLCVDRINITKEASILYMVTINRSLESGQLDSYKVIVPYELASAGENAVLYISTQDGSEYTEPIFLPKTL